MHPRLITVFTKASLYNSYYEPRECNAYASLQGSVKGEKNERKDCHLCGPYVKNVHVLFKKDIKIPGQVAVNRVFQNSV
jgi:hypothetical protein